MTEPATAQDGIFMAGLLTTADDPDWAPPGSAVAVGTRQGIV
jgi:hypothetical protein